MELFKYCQQAHLDGMLAEGRMRLGTLFGYRQSDQGAMIGDADEGSVKVYGDRITKTAEEVAAHPLLGRWIKGAIVGSTFTNCVFGSEDLYLFSTADSYSTDTHRLWLADPEAKYDACYRILSSRLFFRAVSKALPDLDFLGATKVRYYDSERGTHLDSSIASLHPGQLKGGKSYANQVEVRAFWRPKAPQAMHARIIKVPEAAKYCERFAVL